MTVSDTARAAALDAAIRGVWGPGHAPDPATVAAVEAVIALGWQPPTPGPHDHTAALTVALTAEQLAALDAALRAARQPQGHVEWNPKTVLELRRLFAAALDDLLARLATPDTLF